MDTIWELIKKYELKNTKYISIMAQFFLEKSFSLSLCLAKYSFVIGKHVSKATVTCGIRTIHAIRRIKLLIKTKQMENQNFKSFEIKRKRSKLLFLGLV